MQTNAILAAIAVFAAAQFVRPVPVFAEDALAPLADATPRGTTWHPGSEGIMLPAGPFFTKGNQIVDRSGKHRAGIGLADERGAVPRSLRQVGGDARRVDGLHRGGAGSRQHDLELERAGHAVLAHLPGHARSRAGARGD